MIEKGSEVGAHQLSGAIVDPKALDELFDDWRENAPIERFVEREEMCFLTKVESSVRHGFRQSWSIKESQSSR